MSSSRQTPRQNGGRIALLVLAALVWLLLALLRPVGARRSHSSAPILTTGASTAFRRMPVDDDLRPSVRTELATRGVTGRRNPPAVFAGLDAGGNPARLIEALRATEPVEALAYLDGISSSDSAFLFDAYWAVLEPMISSGAFATVRDIIVTTPRHDIQKLLLGAFCDVWGRVAPAEAARWIVSFSPASERSPVLAAIFTGWATRDAPSAMVFATALPSGDARRVAIASVALPWVMHEPAAAGAWLQFRASDPDCGAALLTIGRELAKAAAGDSDGSRADD